MIMNSFGSPLIHEVVSRWSNSAIDNVFKWEKGKKGDFGISVLVINQSPMCVVFPKYIHCVTDYYAHLLVCCKPG